MSQTSKKRILLFIGTVFMLLFNHLMAQPDPGGGGGPGDGCWPPPCIPIDGGIGFLVAAGIAFGVKKAVDLKSPKSQ